MALAATFALHAQGVKDPDNNKATKGQTLYFYGEPDYYQWQYWGEQSYYNWNDESCWYTDSDHEEPVGRIPTATDDVIILPGATCFMPEDGYEFATLTIEDGACLYAPKFAENFVATVKKNIQAYDEYDGWYLLSRQGAPNRARLVALSLTTQPLAPNILRGKGRDRFLNRNCAHHVFSTATATAATEQRPIATELPRSYLRVT